MTTTDFCEATLLIYRDRNSATMGANYSEYEPVIYFLEHLEILIGILQPKIDMSATIKLLSQPSAFHPWSSIEIAKHIQEFWKKISQNISPIVLTNNQETLLVCPQDGIISHNQNPLSFGPCRQYAAASAKALANNITQSLNTHTIVQKSLLICADIARTNKRTVSIKTIDR